MEAPKAKKTAGTGRIRVVMQAFDHRIIDETAKNIVDHIQKSGAVVAGPVPLPTKIRRFTVLRSTFKHKDARDQFERRTHKRLIDITQVAPNTLASLKNLTIPAGVDVEIKM